MNGPYIPLKANCTAITATVSAASVVDKPALTSAVAPISSPTRIQGRRAPNRLRVRSDRTPNNGCATMAPTAERALIVASCPSLFIA